MTISSQVRTAGPFIGNGVATGGPFTFKVFDANQLAGVETSAAGVDRTLVYGVDFSVSLNADQNAAPGGTINYLIAGIGPSLIPLDYQLNFTSNVANLQPVALTNAGGFFPKTINDALDRLTILVQQLVRGVNASLKFPLSDGTTINTTIPNKAARIGKMLAFDPVTGEPVITTLTTAQIEASSGGALLAQQWASLTTGLVAATDYSAKAYAIGGTGVTGVIGSAKEWATSASKPDGVNESAKTYAGQAQTSATNAQNSAGSINYRYAGTATGTANALILTPGTALSSYNGVVMTFLVALANTSETVTANASGLGNRNLKVNPNGTKRNPAINMLQPGMELIVADDGSGTDLIVLNMPWDNKGSDIASAGTLALANVTGNFANVTGTTTITAISGLPEGRRMLLRHTGVHQLTHSAGLFLLNGGANMTTAVGDFSEWINIGGNAIMTRYQRADGRPYPKQVPTLTKLTSGTAATFNVTAGATKLRIRMMGGGGGGGGNGAGATAGSTGGTTSFNAITAIGGSGGNGTTTTSGGAGGAGGTGGSGTALRMNGGAGGTGLATNANYGTGLAYGGQGAFGGGSTGTPAANSGAGGGSAAGTPTLGVAGPGGAGEYAEFWIYAPAASYTYTVGAGGTLGTGGNSNGITGAAGVILVEEFFD